MAERNGNYDEHVPRLFQHNNTEGLIHRQKSKTALPDFKRLPPSIVSRPMQLPIAVWRR